MRTGDVLAKLDAHLHRHIRLKEFFADGVGDYKVRIQAGDQDLGAVYTREIKADGVASNFAVSAKVTDPQHLTDDSVFKFGQNSGFQIVFHANDSGVERLAQIALLKAAYLIAFSQLGYTFILGGCVDEIRQQINRPEQAILPVERLVQPISDGQVVRGMNLVFEPEEYISAFVDLVLAKAPEAAKSCYRVFLPCSSRNIVRWQEIETKKFRCVRIPDGDYIANPRTWIEYERLSGKSTRSH